MTQQGEVRLNRLVQRRLAYFARGKYHCTADQYDQIKIAKCLKKLPNTGFTRKMNDYDTFTKIT